MGVSPRVVSGWASTRCPIRAAGNQEVAALPRHAGRSPEISVDNPPWTGYQTEAEQPAVTALPLQLDSALASASPELRATLAISWGNGEKQQKKLSRPDAEPLPWPGLVHEIFAAPQDGQIG